MGIDSSTSHTGVSLFINEELVFYEFIDTSKRKEFNDKLSEMIIRLDKVIKEKDPDAVFVEGQWSGPNHQTPIKLAFVVGAIKHICIELKTGCNAELPSQWRKDIGIKGKNRKEDKEKAIEYVKNKYGITVNDDVAEGICIGEYGCLVMRDYEKYIEE